MDSSQISHTTAKTTTTRIDRLAQVEQKPSKAQILKKSSIITNSTSRILEELGRKTAQ